VYDHLERQLADTCQDDAAVRRRRLEEELLASGSATSPATCPSRLQRRIAGLHASNIICVQCWPQRRLAVTGSSDGTVTVVGYDGSLTRSMQAGTSGVLCLALAGNSAGSGVGEGSSSLVAAGCMDGSIAVLDAASGTLQARCQPHRKYVVAAAWAADGRHLVTGSWDHSYAVHRLQRQQPAAAQQPTAAALLVAAADDEAAGEPASSCAGWELVRVHEAQTAAKVNAVLPLPSSSGDGGDLGSSSTGSSTSSSFLVAVQGSNYLCHLSISNPAAACDSGAGSPAAAVVREEARINMNARGDDHVSFSAAHLALSPCARLLLVSADNGRLLVYERHGALLLLDLKTRTGACCALQQQLACHSPLSTRLAPIHHRECAVPPLSPQAGRCCAQSSACLPSSSTNTAPPLTAPAAMSWRVGALVWARNCAEVPEQASGPRAACVQLTSLWEVVSVATQHLSRRTCSLTSLDTPPTLCSGCPRRPRHLSRRLSHTSGAAAGTQQERARPVL
jgi:hypothetical protein